MTSRWAVWFTVIWAVGFGCAIAVRLLRLKGKPGGIVEPPPEDIIWNESYASAQSYKSAFTRLGGGNRCIRISLTKHALLIRPHFPFSIVGADADLIHEIPLSSISSVSEYSARGVLRIAVIFGDQRVDLVLKRPLDFLTTISDCLGAGKTTIQPPHSP